MYELEFHVVVVLAVGGDHGAHLQWPTNATSDKRLQNVTGNAQ
jgi:hypothetical protein